MRHHPSISMLILLIVLSACNLSNKPPTAEPLDVPTPNASGKPSVTIDKPKTGDEVVVNTPLVVSAKASDTVGVTRVQLLANDQPVKVVSSEASAGQQSFDAALEYTPRVEGDVKLKVVAYRGAIASDPAEVNVKVRGTQAQVTATIVTGGDGPVIDPNDPTCRIFTNAGLNLREGPGTNFKVLRVLASGTQAPIIGRVGDNSWWQVRVSTRVGWVSSEFTSEYGNCQSVPVITLTPTPTVVGPTLTPTRTPPPPPTATPGLPDLVIASIAGPTDVKIPSGQTEIKQTYVVTITNTGSGPTRQFNNTITLPDGSLSDLGVVANLGPGESISLNVDITFTSPGTYLQEIKADSDGAVTEVSEVNNIAPLKVTVENAP